MPNVLKNRVLGKKNPNHEKKPKCGINPYLKCETCNFFLRYGDTSLIYLCQQSNVNMVHDILKHKDIDINLANHDGFTPLISAASLGNVEIVCIII